MRDSRISTLTRWWAEEIYKSKYGVVAQWTGRDAKLLQSLLANATTNYGEQAVQEIGEALDRYVNDPDPFYAKDSHPFSKFASNPMRWMAKRNGQSVKNTPKIIREKPVAWQFTKISDEQIAEYVKRSPEAFARGLAYWRGPMLKNHTLQENDPAFFNRVAAQIGNVMGKDKARAAYLSASTIAKTF